jgi:hypothetical protein
LKLFVQSQLITKFKKEARMKKLVILFLALIIAVPAIANAGAVNERWDMTIGGMVKFDFGWITQSNRSAFNAARPEDRSGPTSNNFTNRGTFYMNASETELSFLIKGPDTMGAKSSALIVADFSSGWNGGGTASGMFGAKIAKMQFDWPSTKLEIGVFPTMNGAFPTHGGNYIGYGMGNEFDKGHPSIPQINVTQQFGKLFTMGFGVLQYSATAFGGTSTSGQINNYTEYGIPAVQGFFQYNTDSCGKVGPWGLNLKFGGSYGRQRIRDAAGYAGQVFSALGDSTADAYAVDFAWTVPIIPQKGNQKRNGLLFAGSVYQMQGQSMYAPAPATFITAAGAQDATFLSIYQRGDNHYARPVINGVIGQLQYWWTDQLFSNFFYGQTHAAYSRRITPLIANTQNQRMIVANIMYDVSPAVRFGFEWNNVNTSYAMAPPALVKRHGEVNAFRVGAYYFF